MQNRVLWVILSLSALGTGCGGARVDAVDSSAQLAQAARSPRPGTAGCILPWGVNLCELGGVTTAALISPDLGLGGDPLLVGSWWTPMVVWGTNKAGGLLPDFPIAYHPGYASASPDDPMRDFLDKLVSFTIVVDPGTRQERAYVFAAPRDIVRVTTFGDYWGPAGYFGYAVFNPMAWATFFPVLHPLDVGGHAIHLVWTMSAEHCDGIPSLGGEPLTFEGGHCIPAGDTAWIPDVHPSYRFQVVHP